MEKGNDVLSERTHKPNKKINVGCAIGYSLMFLSIIISLTIIYFVLSLILKG